MSLNDYKLTKRYYAFSISNKPQIMSADAYGSSIVGPYSFIFFNSERGEPAHIHIKREWQIAKFWLDPVSLEKTEALRNTN